MEPYLGRRSDHEWLAVDGLEHDIPRAQSLEQIFESPFEAEEVDPGSVGAPVRAMVPAPSDAGDVPLARHRTGVVGLRHERIEETVDLKKPDGVRPSADVGLHRGRQTRQQRAPQYRHFVRRPVGEGDRVARVSQPRAHLRRLERRIATLEKPRRNQMVRDCVP